MNFDSTSAFAFVFEIILQFVFEIKMCLNVKIWNECGCDNGSSGCVVLEFGICV